MKRTCLMISCLAAAAFLGLASIGCGLLQNGSGFTTDEKAAHIYEAAAATTSIAILEIYKDNPTKQVEVAKEMKERVDKDVLGDLLSNPMSIPGDLVEPLLSAFPPAYFVYLQSAIGLFKSYYRPAPGDLLDTDSANMLIALFKGVSDGCRRIIDANAAKV